MCNVPFLFVTSPMRLRLGVVCLLGQHVICNVPVLSVPCQMGPCLEVVWPWVSASGAGNMLTFIPAVLHGSQDHLRPIQGSMCR